MVQIYKQTSEIYKACFDISQRVKCIFAVYRKLKQTSEIYKACFDISQRVKCIFAVYRKFIKNGYTQHFRCIHLRKHPTTNSYMLSKLQFYIHK